MKYGGTGPRGIAIGRELRMVRIILRAGKRGVARDQDLADFHLRAFVDVEGELHGVRSGKSFVGGLDGRELAAVLGQQFFQDHFRFLDARGIELALDRQADFAVLEAVQDVGLGNRFVAFVLDAPDDRPFGHIKNDNFLVGFVGAVLNFQPDVLEILRVPQRMEIATERVFVYRIAGTGKNAGSKRFAANSSIALEFDALDGGGACRGRSGPPAAPAGREVDRRAQRAPGTRQRPQANTRRLARSP